MGCDIIYQTSSTQTHTHCICQADGLLWLGDHRGSPSAPVIHRFTAIDRRRATINRERERKTFVFVTLFTSCHSWHFMNNTTKTQATNMQQLLITNSSRTLFIQSTNFINYNI